MDKLILRDTTQDLQKVLKLFDKIKYHPLAPLKPKKVFSSLGV
ncbi:hypothetical protein THER_1209 [Thermodesulfovibrio sp. N1]|nr:hypothetical protein THER_1209 [Thermodesulfovibrio sp. N1]